jgi:hypothetical protein
MARGWRRDESEGGQRTAKRRSDGSFVTSRPEMRGGQRAERAVYREEPQVGTNCWRLTRTSCQDTSGSPGNWTGNMGGGL